MIDLRNQELIKVMWIPGEDEILFDIKNGIPIPLTSKLYVYLAEHISVNKWRDLYKAKYEDWLYKDDASIYDINHKVNTTMIYAISKVNETLSGKMLLYWFDVDRTTNENFVWQECPLSQNRLLRLGANYPHINVLMSPDYPLIFPNNP